MDLYEGIFGEPCMNFAECGNFVLIHGSLCADCEARAALAADDVGKTVVVCAGCGSIDDGFGFANGTCANCGSMTFDIEEEEER